MASRAARQGHLGSLRRTKSSGHLPHDQLEVNMGLEAMTGLVKNDSHHSPHHQLDVNMGLEAMAARAGSQGKPRGLVKQAPTINHTINLISIIGGPPDNLMPLKQNRIDEHHFSTPFGPSGIRFPISDKWVCQISESESSK